MEIYIFLNIGQPKPQPQLELGAKEAINYMKNWYMEENPRYVEADPKYFPTYETETWHAILFHPN
jgi:hypothetical protein